MFDIIFPIVCSVISFLLSLLGSFIFYKFQETKKRERDLYFNFYYPFYILWDGIHQARAYNFSDLNTEDQEKIVSFLIEHSPYAGNELSEQIYILKCSRLDNFDNMNSEFIKASDEAYNKITDIMIDKENSLRKKYISKK